MFETHIFAFMIIHLCKIFPILSVIFKYLLFNRDNKIYLASKLNQNRDFQKSLLKIGILSTSPVFGRHTPHSSPRVIPYYKFLYYSNKSSIDLALHTNRITFCYLAGFPPTMSLKRSLPPCLSRWSTPRTPSPPRSAPLLPCPTTR